MNIGRAIVKVRKDNGWTQRELAEKMGIRANHLCEMEKGKRRIDNETLTAICDTMYVDVADIIFESIEESDFCLKSDYLLWKNKVKPIIDLLFS